MRIFLSLFLLASSLLSVTGQDAPEIIKTPFNRLKVSGNIHLFLVQDSIQGLAYKKGVKPETDLEQGIADGCLQMKTRSELTQSEAISLYLHYRSLNAMELQKGARVQSADTLKTKALSLEVLNGAKAELVLCVDSLHARVNQGADIVLYGKADVQQISAYTWGNYLAYDMEATDAYIKAATGAQVKVWCTGLLQANATSKAFIGYKGNPKKKKLKATVGGQILTAD